MSRQESNWELKGGNYLKIFFFLLIGKNIQFIILYFFSLVFWGRTKGDISLLLFKLYQQIFSEPHLLINIK